MTYEEKLMEAMKVRTAKIIRTGPEGCRKYIASFEIELEDPEQPSHISGQGEKELRERNALGDIGFRAQAEEIKRLRECLGELVEAEEKIYKDAKDYADWFNNNTDNVGIKIPYATYPSMPGWVTKAKSLLNPDKTDL